MAPVIVDPKRIKAFATDKAFEAWLAKHHDKDPEIWIRIYKKGSKVRSVTPAEAIDVVLCWGWIDGQRKGYDEQSFLQRYSPRGAKSIWSEINRDNVARLIEAKRMTPHGLRQIEAAKADGRWAAAYKGSRTMTMPEDLMRAIAADQKAAATFAKLNKQNRYALAFRLGNLKTAAGREKKIATFVQMLRRGETIHPQRG
jgi:uncharacterized protein YdeI (YjbR/CyaY-like superfamily)